MLNIPEDMNFFWPYFLILGIFPKENVYEHIYSISV